MYLGLCVKTVDGQTIEYGDVEQRFTMQSICKVASLAAALQHDGSGEFAVRVGMPAKSGVGGGIMACVENQLGIGTYGPALDEKGNSIGGKNALEYLSREMHYHIFDSERD